MFATDFLLASLFWGSLGTGCLVYPPVPLPAPPSGYPGSLGTGCLVYGKKQGSAPALVAGFALLLCSYFAPGALWMSGLSVLLLGGMVWGIRRGY